MRAAEMALEKGNVNYVLPWVHKEGEKELTEAFEKALEARKLGPAARGVADDWFFETAVRVHRAGEGAPYTGLKPAGLDPGPVLPLAEKALETGSAEDLVRFLSDTLADKIRHRLHRAMAVKDFDVDDVPAAREYVQASLGVMLFSHHLYEFIEAGGEHGEGSEGRTHAE